MREGAIEWLDLKGGVGGGWGQALRLTELDGDGMLAQTRLGSKKIEQCTIEEDKTKMNKELIYFDAWVEMEVLRRRVIRWARVWSCSCICKTRSILI